MSMPAAISNSGSNRGFGGTELIIVVRLAALSVAVLAPWAGIFGLVEILVG